MARIISSQELFQEAPKKIVSSEELFAEPQVQKESPISGAMDVLKRTVQAGPASYLGISGGPSSELGHHVKSKIFESTGMSPLVSESLSGASDPQNMFMTAASMQPTFKALTSKLRPNPAMLEQKALKLSTEILNPPKGELARSIEKNQPFRASKQLAENIKPAKSYTDLKSHLEDVTKKTFEERNGLLQQIDIAEGGRPIGTSYIDRLKKSIDELVSKGQSTDSEIAQMNEVLKKEIEYYSKNPLTRVSGQSRKEYLQDLTESLLQKTEKGDVIDTQPARNRALNELRKGLKESVEGKYGKIKELNSKYSGLKRATELLSGQEALAQKAIPAGKLQKAIRFITNPRNIPGAVADSALENQGSLQSKTKEIFKLMKKK